MNKDLQVSNVDCTLNYDRYGNGSKILLAFHGFGQGKEVYNPLSEVLKDYTIFSFDLFFHGKSTYKNKNRPIEPTVIIDLLTLFLEKESIKTFSLIGFSMGAKFALLITHHFSQKILQLVLIGPDGIVPNIWYRLATGNVFARMFYKMVVFEPSLFVKFISLALYLKLTKPSTLKFAQNQMDTRNKRMQVYKSWMNFRNIKTPFRRLVALHKEQKFKITIFLGLQDFVIPAKKIAMKAKRLNQVELIYLESRHSTLLVEATNYIKINKILD